MIYHPRERDSHQHSASTLDDIPAASFQVKASVGVKLATKLVSETMVRSSRVALRFSDDAKSMGEETSLIVIFRGSKACLFLSNCL